MKHRFAPILVLMVALAAPAFAHAAWSNYVGPEATFYQTGPTGGSSGWNYHTNNRVWRNPGHPFQLVYQPAGGSLHWSTSNWGSNPFEWPAYGYNWVGCVWNNGSDPSWSIFPVTCQGFS